MNSITVPVLWHQISDGTHETWIGNYRLRAIGGGEHWDWYVDLIWADAGRSLQPIGHGTVPVAKGGKEHSKQAAEFSLIRHLIGGHVGNGR